MPTVLLQNIHLLIMYTMLVLMLVLLQKGRKHPRSLVLALYALVEVINNSFIYLSYAAGWEFYVSNPFFHFIYKPFYCLWVPLFYLYFRYSLSANFKVSQKHLIHFVPFVIFAIIFVLILLTKGNTYIFENLYNRYSNLYILTLSVDATVKIQYLLYNITMIRLLLASQKRYSESSTHHPPISYRWLQFITYGYAVGCFGATLNWLLFLTSSPTHQLVTVISTSYFFLFFFIIFYNTISQKQFTNRVKSKHNQPSVKELNDLMSRIDSTLIDKGMYLEPELTLQQIAKALNEKERNVSQAINTLKSKNVNEYINQLRVKHACELLHKNTDMPIFEVMYSSGFNTKGAFNLAFKRIVGVTPTEYRVKKT